MLPETMLESIIKNENDFFHDKSILGDGVEFIGLINKEGRMESSMCKNEINLTEDRKEMFLMQFRLQSSMQRDYDDEFGPVSHTITERENSIFVSIPIVSHTVLAIMKKHMNPTVAINKIKLEIRNFENRNKELSVQSGQT
jgi:hypothetical protein